MSGSTQKDSVSETGFLDRESLAKWPYPGLRPFRRDEAELFFGREQQIKALRRKLDHYHLTAVVGPSGCGKSSLVRAGLFGELDSAALYGDHTRWRTVILRPGEHPLAALAEALVRGGVFAEAPGEEADVVREAGPLYATLRRGALGLIEALELKPLPAHTKLLIVVDQFEEVFRFRQEAKTDEADAFVSLLLRTVQGAQGQPDAIPVYVIITMRSDFIGHCDQFPGLPEAINESQFLTPRMTREQRRAAIAGPAAMRGGVVEPALISRLLNDMGDEPDQLPIVQHALMRLWVQAWERDEAGDAAPLRLTEEDYERAGGWQETLSNHADEACEELRTCEQRQIAEVLFRCLTERQPGQGDVRRPVKLSEVARVAGVPTDEVKHVVAKFRREDRSFLVPPVGEKLRDDTMLDISHESLIRQWRRLRGWVEAEARSAEEYRRLEQTALRLQGKGFLKSPDLDVTLQWRRQQQPTAAWAQRYGAHYDLAMRFLADSENSRQEDLRREQEAACAQLRRTQWTVAIVVVFLVLAIIAAAIGWYQYGVAEDAKKDAEIARRETEIAKGHLELARLDDAIDLTMQEDYAAARLIFRELAEKLKDNPLLKTKPRRFWRLFDWYARFMGLSSKPAHALEVAGGLRAFRDFSVSPDGKWLVAVGEQGTIVLLDAVHGQQQQKLNAQRDGANVLTRVVFDPHGEWFATGGSDGIVRRYAVSDAERPATFTLLDELGKPASADTPEDDVNFGVITSLAVDPQGKRLAIGGKRGTALVWELETATPVELYGAFKWINDLAFSSDGKNLAAAFENRVIIWDVAQPDAIWKPYPSSSDMVRAVTFHPQGSWLAVSRGSAIELVNVATVNYWDAMESFRGHRESVVDLEFIQMGGEPCLVSSSLDRTLRIWNIHHGTTIRVLHGHASGVRAATLDANHPARLFSVGMDGAVLNWELGQPADLRVTRLQVSPDEARSRASGAGSEGELVDSGSLSDRFSSAAFAPNGGSIVVRDRLGKLSQYDLPSGKLVWETADRDGEDFASAVTRDPAIRDLLVSPDGNFVASLDADANLQLWRVQGDQAERLAELPDYKVKAMVFLPAQGPRSGALAVACDDPERNGRVVRIDLPAPGKADCQPVALLDDVAMDAIVAFDPTRGQLLGIPRVVGKSFRIFRQDPFVIGPPAELLEVPPPESGLDRHTVAVSPRGDRLAVADAALNDFVWIYDVGPGEVVHEPTRLSGIEGSLYSAEFDRTGKLLVVVTDAGTVWLCDVTEKPTEILRLPIPADLSKFAACWFGPSSTGEMQISVALRDGRVFTFERIPLAATTNE